jgi:fermentation-respiration switch protein FrsA (DUF1100 family)
VTRSDVRIQTGDGELGAWLYRPDTSEGTAVPCVVLGHGFTAVRDMHLQRPAERFAEAGMASLVFDYRHFGDSDGEPRQVLDLARQYEDWDAAIAFARRLDGIDPSRVILWGTSFSGGHVIDAAVRHPEVAAVIAQAPFMDGLAQVLLMPPQIGARLVFDGFRDEMRRLRGRPPLTVPAACAPGGYAMLPKAHVWDSLSFMVPEGSTWRNEVAARIALHLPHHRPVRRARRVACPVLVQVLEDETVLATRPPRRAARKAPKGELRTYKNLDHFDVYVGEGFELLSRDQIAFLSRVLSEP